MKKSKRPYLIMAYKGRNGWFWRLKAPNGLVVGDGSQPYATKGSAVRAIRNLIASEIIDVTPEGKS
jgi:uncharacterized protein YegP (UPF0339 family)